mgnify:CR=1 FL=1
MNESALASVKSVQEAASRLLRAELKDKPVLNSWVKLLDYCRAEMGHLKTEQFRILFLNNKNILIADEVQQVGTVNHTPVYPREVIKRALELSATAIILVHNHPSGDPTPSDADRRLTRRLREAAEKANVATQMGTQIHAGDNYRRVVELIQSGAIGPVREVHVWVSRAWGLQSAEDAKKYGDTGWKKWEASFRDGFKDGSRVLVRYTPK